MTLNDGGVATYSAAQERARSHSSTQWRPDRTQLRWLATAVNLNGATIKDGAGNAANLSLSGLTQNGPQIDTISPAVTALVASPISGDFGVGQTVTFTLSTNEAVIVSGGTPTLTLNDGGVATHSGGSGTGTLTFAYTVAAGQNAASLAATSVNLNGAIIQDGAGRAANLSLAGLAQTGPQIDTTAPVLAAIALTPSAADLGAAQTVTFTLSANEAVTVTGGPPTLTLNDGGVATYSGGSGSGALTFVYTVAPGDNTAALAATAFNFNGAMIADGAGNAASLSLNGLTQNGPQIDTVAPNAPTITSDVVTGNTVAFAGLAEANATIAVYDGAVQVGAATANSSGAWTLTVGSLISGDHIFTATATDGAGNTSASSDPVDPTIDATPPTMKSLLASPGAGDLGVGQTVTFALAASEIVTVSGGTPTLTLNDGGVATYVGGSGSGTLTFSYVVAPGQNTASLAATAVNLNGATIADAAGNGANLSLSGLVQNGPQIDGAAPVLTALTETPAAGNLNVGQTVTFTLTASEAVTVIGGTPTLTLNDGGVATYVGGTGSAALTFSYSVAAGENTASLAANAVNLNGASIKDAAGNAANLSLTGLTQHGPQVNTATPFLAGVTQTPATGDLHAGETATITVTTNEAVTVAGGTPTLTLNDGGVATYKSGSGTSTLIFSYTVAAGQNTSALAATAFNLNGATVKDSSGNAANLSLTGLTQSGPQIDTLAPTIKTVTQTAATGAVGLGQTVTFTLTLSEAVTIAGGAPKLSLNDGGVATYVGGSGGAALTFSYVAAAGQNVAKLAATGVTLNGATIKDLAGNAANLSLTGLAQNGPLIDTIAPAIKMVTETPAAGAVELGQSVTFTLTASETLTVAGGTPTLTLNDGGVATYVGGSGTTALQFSYTAAAGQNTTKLAATAVNLNGATIKDSAGNAAGLS